MTTRALVAASAVVALVAAAFHATYAFHGIALFDEGLLADGAWRVRDGAVIGRDAFVPYGPASYWLLAPCFAWFGQSMATLRAVTVVVQAAADGALFGIAAASGSWVGGLLAATLLAVAHGSLHKSFLLLAVMLALLAGRSLGRRATLGAAGLAGAFAGVAFLFRHDVGAFAGVALVAGVCLETAMPRPATLQRVLALVAGFAAVVGPALLALLAAGLDLESWWAHEWQRIAVQERIDVALAPPWDADGQSGGRIVLFTALLLAPLVHLLWGGAVVLRRWRGGALVGDGARLANALFGLLLLNQARLIPSTNHLFQAMAPLALALADLLARREHGLVRRLLLVLIVAAMTTWAALGRSGPYAGTFKQRIDGAVRLDVPAGGIWLRPDFAAALTRVVASIQARVGPDETIVTTPGSPLLGFLAERRLALPYAEPSYYYHDERFRRGAIDAVERERPPLFVSDGSEPAGYRFAEAAPLLAQHLAQHYRPFDTIGPFTLFERVR